MFIFLIISLPLVLPGCSDSGSKKKNPDTTPPVINITSPAEGALLGAGIVTITGTAGDNAGISRVEISIDNGQYIQASGTSTWTYSLDTTILTNGNHSISAKALDLSNNESVSSINITVDNLFPSGTFVINNDNRYTSSTSVTLNTNITGVTEMRFSNDNSTWSVWESYSSSKSWTLIPGHGGRTVYGEFRDAAGNVSQKNDIITPLIEQKITASDGAGGDRFGGTNDFNPNGNCIAVSNNGNVIAVGAYWSLTAQGSAYVYRWNGSTWNEYKLTAKAGVPAELFGFSVALSEDGSVIAIGALNGDSTAGSAFIYKWNGNNYGLWNTGTSHWDENQKIKPSDSTVNWQFGVSVVIAGDGKTVVVGQYKDNLTGTTRGSAYIYKWNESESMFGIKNNGTLNWDENQKIIASDGADNDNFGFNVAISSDSKTIVVGSIMGDGAAANCGVAYVFKWDSLGLRYGILNSGKSNENFKIYSSDASILFGRSVSSSSDGTNLLIGAYRSTVGSNVYQGSVYLFKWNGSDYDQCKKFTASDGAGYDYFGYSVSISGDGNRVLIGALGDNVGSNIDQGSAYVYDWDGSNWVETIVRASDGNPNEFYGYSAGMSSDGHTIAVSAPGKTVGTNSNQGAVYIY